MYLVGCHSIDVNSVKIWVSKSVHCVRCDKRMCDIAAASGCHQLWSLSCDRHSSASGRNIKGFGQQQIGK